MKRLIYLLLVINLISCGKDESFTNQQSQLTKTQPRNISTVPDSLWNSPSQQQLSTVWTHMMENANVNEIGQFVYKYGSIRFDYARVVKEFSDSKYVISIPTINTDSVSSVLFASVIDGAINYLHFEFEDFDRPLDDIVNEFGVETSLAGILEFLKYEQMIGSYISYNLYYLLNDPILRAAIHEIQFRGYCLIEIALVQSIELSDGYTFEISSATGQLVVQNSEGEIVLTSQDKKAKKKANIGGTTIEDIMYIYIWAWCEDDIGQDPWSYNWTNNIGPPNTGGNGNTDPGPYDWDYDQTNWDDATKECLLMLNPPKADKEINDLKDLLLSQSCGEGNAYKIQSLFHSFLLGLCNEYYGTTDVEDDGFPGFPGQQGFEAEDVKTDVEDLVTSSEAFAQGQEVCYVCDNALDTEACLDTIDSCPPVGYHECVDEKLCNQAIATFESDYGIKLTDEEKGLIKGIGSCGGVGFGDDVLAILAADYLATNSIAQQASSTFLGNYTVDEDLLKHRDRLVLKMKYDSDYAEFVESSFGWSGAMWAIAKELIGDKLIDVLGDAIKAAKNGDPFGVIYNAALVVGKNSPLGKAIKAAEVSVEMVSFENKVSKIWDKIGTYAENVIESMWDIVKTYPKALRTNTDLIGGLAKTIKRGLKSIDDMAQYADDIGASYLNQTSVRHILRGDGFNSGRHHISALVSDPTIQVTHIVDKGQGFYKASLRKATNPPLTMDDKSFFPDDWSEYEEIDAIKEAYDSNPSKNILDTVTFEGTIVVDGINKTNKIVKENGIIKTAYPK
jgi:hypothetical protein